MQHIVPMIGQQINFVGGLTALACVCVYLVKRGFLRKR